MEATIPVLSLGRAGINQRAYCIIRYARLVCMRAWSIYILSMDRM